MPRSPIEATTQFRSAVAAASFAADAVLWASVDEVFEASIGAGDAAAADWLGRTAFISDSLEGSSFGLDKASATRLAFPWTYLMSVVNSLMQLN